MKRAVSHYAVPLKDGVFMSACGIGWPTNERAWTGTKVPWGVNCKTCLRSIRANEKFKAELAALNAVNKEGHEK